MFASRWHVRPSRRSGCARPRARIWLQPLENRLAPAQLVVTSSADSGTGSLRAIMATANSNGDVITIDKATFDHNQCTGIGGAINCAAGGSLTIRNTTMSSNSTPLSYGSYGGAVSCKTATSFTLEDTTIRGNSSSLGPICLV